MNNTKVESLYRQIKNAAQVFAWTEKVFLDIEFEDISGDPKNVVMVCSSREERGFFCYITEKGLDKATLKKNIITLKDNNNELFSIKLFANIPITIKKEWEQ